jgi:hypothetical protein
MHLLLPAATGQAQAQTQRAWVETPKHPGVKVEILQAKVALQGVGACHRGGQAAQAGGRCSRHGIAAQQGLR